MLKDRRVCWLNWICIVMSAVDFARCLVLIYRHVLYTSGLHCWIRVYSYFAMYVLEAVASLVLIYAIYAESPKLMLPMLVVLALSMINYIFIFHSVLSRGCHYPDCILNVVMIILIISVVTTFMVAIYVLYQRTTNILRRKRATADQTILQNIPMYNVGAG